MWQEKESRLADRAAELYEVRNSEGVEGVFAAFWSEEIEWHDDSTASEWRRN